MPDKSSPSGLEPATDVVRAVAFLTRIPVRLPPDAAARPLSTCAWAFPLAGLLVGGIGGAVYVICAELGLAGLVGALAAVAATVMVTGALHEDGLADVADGFGGGADRERKLAIMRDSRIGTYGTIALVVAVGLRAGAVAQILDPGMALAAMVAAGSYSRAAAAVALGLMPAARPDGLGANAGKPSPAVLLLAAALGIAVPVVALGAASLVALVVGALAAVAVGALAQRQVGGQTGDVLGALQQAAEVGVLCAVAAAY